jgi:hypothetical protein
VGTHLVVVAGVAGVAEVVDEAVAEVVVGEAQLSHPMIGR